MDPSLQDIATIPDNSFEFVYHVGSYFNMYSIISLWIDNGRQKSWKRSTKSMNKNGFEQGEQDLTKTRHAANKQTW